MHCELRNLKVIKHGDDFEDWDFTARNCKDCNILEFTQTYKKGEGGRGEATLQTSPNLKMG